MKRLAITALCTFSTVAGASTAAADSGSFTSPSGNIGCYMDSDSVRCDINERDWTRPPRPSDCPSQTGYGQGITIGVHGRAKFVCGGDTVLGVGSPLPYGQYYASGGISCNSEESGMRCSNSDGHGFTLAKEAYSLF